MNRINLTLLFFALLFLGQLQAQSHIARQIEELEKDFHAFEYNKVLEKGNFLLSDPYVTKEDSLQILKYMLSSAYALSDTIEAKKIIHKIIKCDANFVLSPVETSPKIIEFFEHVKRQIKQNKPIVPLKPQIITVVKPASLPLASSMLTLLLPGSGHLHQKFKKKGMMYSGISLGMIGGMIYAAIETEKKEDQYLSAKPGADFDRLYDDYNRFYRARNLLFAAFLAWDFYVFYDLNKEWQVHIKSRVKNDGVAVQLSWKW
ncbi:hypothetical protein [Caldithrix abyssi]